MNGTVTTAHRLQQDRYTQRIAEHGILATLAPYRLERRIPAQRDGSVVAARSESATA